MLPVIRMDNQTVIPIRVEGGAEQYEPTIQRLCEIVWRHSATSMDLSTLEAITVSGTYEQSVAQIDLGYVGAKPLSPTIESFGAGKAWSLT